MLNRRQRPDDPATSNGVLSLWHREGVGDREIKLPMLVVAALCLLTALGGGALLFVDGGQTLGVALLGFFGAGAFVLGRKALGLD
jgi:hypothetical protein